MLTSVKLLTWG